MTAPDRAALAERDEDGRTLADRLAEYPDGLRQIQRECELGPYLENVADDCEAAAAALLAASERETLSQDTLQELLDGWLQDHRACLTFGAFAVERLARLAADPKEVPNGC